MAKMLALQKERAKRCHELGVATTEFAICCPMLVIVITASLDFASVLGQFGQLEEAVHDGIRYASSINTIEAGNFYGRVPGTNTSCGPTSSLTPPTLHQLLQDRVMELTRTNSRNLNLNTICINSEAFLASNGTRSIRLRIQVNYNGIFPGAANLPISVEATGPIL
jgi:Flp pilus assembly protein TadG